MSKEPTVSVRELLEELNYGKGLTLPESQRKVTNDTIVRVMTYLKAKKASKPKKIRNPSTPSKLYTLQEWEALWCGPLNVQLMDTWATEKVLCKRQLAQLIEEFRTEMMAKNKMYADFKAAFQVYLTKGYLSKRIDQVKLAPGEGNKWGNVQTTRGASL